MILISILLFLLFIFAFQLVIPLIRNTQINLKHLIFLMHECFS